ncbi:MAG: hypothetical protein MJE66_02545 [Proteobacteria bacterium]|nr:hypothetical protein [Pseudomonadota bacterium]
MSIVTTLLLWLAITALGVSGLVALETGAAKRAAPVADPEPEWPPALPAAEPAPCA